MSVYRRNIDAVTSTITFEQTEKHIYGSARVGIYNESLPLLGTQNAEYSQTMWTHTIGKRSYELQNHLGNVLSVISDKPLPHDDDSDGVVDWYLADIKQSTDYSPFGVQLSGRNFTASNAKEFRYGFNNMEEDDEIKGDGNSYDFGARMLDPRLGKWLTIDPLQSKYPMDSPYMFASNSPLAMHDPDGKEKIIAIGSDNKSWNLRFALTGMKKARDLKEDAGDEQVTVLLFKAGYSDKQISRIQKYMNKEGIVVQVVTSSDDVVNYFNNKSISTTQSGRKEDPISTVSIFAHGLPGEIAFGYHQSTEDKYRFDKEDVKKIESSAFKTGAVIRSYACRTGNGNDNLKSNFEPENSLAQEMANQWGVTVYALQKRSDYENILPNNTTYGKLMEAIMMKDTTYDKDAGSWDTDDAIDKVKYPVEGDTPEAAPGWTKFQKNKTPVVE